METGKNRKSSTEREAIEHQLTKLQASIASVETAAEIESAKVTEPESSHASRVSDRLVELLIARLLRIAHRDDLLKQLAHRFLSRIRR